MLPDVPRTGRRRCWFRASTITKYVTIRSEVGWFIGHWKGGAVRCPGPELCTICASGATKRLFTYVFIEDEHGEVLVFEIPERLRELAEELEDEVGTQLAIVRDGTARNSRIDVLHVGREPSEKLDIWPFVNTLGNRHHSPIDLPDQSESSSPPKTAAKLP